MSKRLSVDPSLQTGHKAGDRNGAPDRMYLEVLSKGLRVLEAYAENPSPKTLSKLSAATGIDRSSIQRIAHTLVKTGYIERNEDGLILGRKILDRTFDYLRSSDLVNRAIPILAELRRSLNERIDLSLFDDTDMLFLVRMQSKRDTPHKHYIGRRVPTYCSSGGIAVLSHLEQDKIDDIVSRSERHKITPHTMTDPDEIQARIEQARESGFALVQDQVALGEIIVASAILGPDKRPVGAIHVAASQAEWPEDAFRSQVGPLVSTAALSLGPI